jgi:hypothetical protein
VDSYMLVRQAILEKKQVIANYNGYRRDMCPHVLGWKRVKRRGTMPGRREAHALLYQFAGGSRSGLDRDGSPNNWRCVNVAQLTLWPGGAGPAPPPPTESRPQTCVDEIDVEAAA